MVFENYFLFTLGIGGLFGSLFQCLTTNCKAFRTGRMHHLRVALLFIGFRNFPIYSTFIGSHNGRRLALLYEIRRNKVEQLRRRLGGGTRHLGDFGSFLPRIREACSVPSLCVCVCVCYNYTHDDFMPLSDPQSTRWESRFAY